MFISFPQPLLLYLNIFYHAIRFFSKQAVSFFTFIFSSNWKTVIQISCFVFVSNWKIYNKLKSKNSECFLFELKIRGKNSPQISEFCSNLFSFQDGKQHQLSFSLIHLNRITGSHISGQIPAKPRSAGIFRIRERKKKTDCPA